MANFMAAPGLSYDFINGTVSVAVSNQENTLKETVAALGDNASASDLLVLQQQTSKWTLMTQIQSTIVQLMSEAMKGIIQKSG